MNTAHILQELRAERERITQAISAIEGLFSDRATGVPAAKGARPRMSPAARTRISEARKQWWAAQKKAATPHAKKSSLKSSAAKKASGNGGMSAAARRRISLAKKRWWAEQKKKVSAKKTAPKPSAAVRKVARKLTKMTSKPPAAKKALVKQPALKKSVPRPTAVAKPAPASATTASAAGQSDKVKS